MAFESREEQFVFPSMENWRLCYCFNLTVTGYTCKESALVHLCLSLGFATGRSCLNVYICLFSRARVFFGGCYGRLD